MKTQLILTGHSLSIAQLRDAVEQNFSIEIDEKAIEKVANCRKVLENKIANGDIIYGVNTGFGSNVDIQIDAEQAIEMQTNLLRSHACGVGKPLIKPLVKAIMIIRLNTLLQGHSGVRVQLIKTFKQIINKGIYPVIPEQGSVGASGDLCPLSHMALALIGEGKVEFEGKIYSDETEIKTLYKQLEITPLQLSYKEGLALNNGTTFMAALGAMLVDKAEKLCKLATLCSCLAFEAIGARNAAFTNKIHDLRHHQGQIFIAQLVNKYTSSSKLFGISSKTLLNQLPNDVLQNLSQATLDEIEKLNEQKSLKLSLNALKEIPEKWQGFIKYAVKKSIPQDAYSIRCTPQVLGASWQAIQHAKKVVEGELNAVVDNPIMLPEDGAIISGGNFHGQPIALVLDYLKIAIAEIGNLLERQINKLCDPNTNDGLPAFLVNKVGLHSGMMIPQYTAAALVSENKVLAHPASVDSIPTCANQEDHVSMGPIGGRQALEILKNVEKIVAIHLLTSTQAIDVRRNQFLSLGLYKPEIGIKTNEIYNEVRKIVDFVDEDRFLHQDIETILNHLPGFYGLVKFN